MWKMWHGIPVFSIYHIFTPSVGKGMLQMIFNEYWTKFHKLMMKDNHSPQQWTEDLKSPQWWTDHLATYKNKMLYTLLSGMWPIPVTLSITSELF